jgi:F-type H+-transporting ATPase subunit c
MDNSTIIAVTSMICASATVTLGTIIPDVAEGITAKQAIISMAQQPDEASEIRSTAFVSMAMLESCAIYCLLISMILIFSNPFWNWVVEAK